MNDSDHIQIIEAMRSEQRREIAKLKMQLILYREMLIENDIEPPDRDDEELMRLYQNCCAVISTASVFVSDLRSAKELL